MISGQLSFGLQAHKCNWDDTILNVSFMYHLVSNFTTRWGDPPVDPGISSWATSAPPRFPWLVFSPEAEDPGAPCPVDLGTPGPPEVGCALGGTSMFWSLDQISCYKSMTRYDKARKEKPCHEAIRNHIKSMKWIELKWLKMIEMVKMVAINLVFTQDLFFLSLILANSVFLGISLAGRECTVLKL